MTEESDAPDPLARYPVAGHSRVVFIKAVTNNPKIVAGDYSYYDDPDDPEGFERNMLYAYGPERLIIGKFCAIASGVKFIMSGANHKLDAVSTFPFPIFGGAWGADIDMVLDLPSRGDTVIGNDVWIGYGAVIMPGVTIGDGAIIAAQSVVVGDVPAYSIYGGNPARLLRKRFTDADTKLLMEIRWWDWPVDKITRNLRALMRADVAALTAAD